MKLYEFGIALWVVSTVGMIIYTLFIYEPMCVPYDPCSFSFMFDEMGLECILRVMGVASVIVIFFGAVWELIKYLKERGSVKQG